MLKVGTLSLDPATHRVTTAIGELELSRKEFALLEMFMRRSGEALPRNDILEHVWDWAYDGTSNVIDVYVRYLRQKLGDGPGMPHIETVRGIGYALREAT